MIHDDLRLRYQPIFDLQRGEISGAEALLRIDPFGQGELEPREFLALAEDSGLMVAYGEWVIRTVCGQIQVWQQAGKSITVTVNISERQFNEGTLPDIVRSALNATGVPAANLELDLTASFLMKDVDRTILTLHELHALGVRLVLDDFGTGYSSLQHLQKLPLDALKIDLAFVRGLPTREEDAVIVRAALAIAREMSFEAMAEGVETQAQFEFLKVHGCQRLQGYFIGRPVPAPQFFDCLSQAEVQTLASSHL